VIWVAFAVAVGTVVRRHARRTASFQLQAETAVQDRDRMAAVAVAAERSRIARELHDVVAHAIGVIVLQARGGRKVMDVDPAQTAAALNTIEEVGGQALTEMRRLLAILRADEQPLSPYAPQPSLRRLDAITSTLPDVRVSVDVTGDLSRLPPGLDLTGYRIVQEALTNVLKHSSATSVTLRIKVDTSALTLEIVDDGNAEESNAGHGLGVPGMRERVALFGGVLDVGAQPEGGFRVRARLPLTSAP
jgi:signal transduction histidine kinase